METVNITRYEVTMPGALDDFTEMVHQLQLKYSTGNLALAGLKADEVSCAVSRAMRICRLNDIDTRDHFRSLYIFDGKSGTVFCDWRMSRQGFMLALMNAPNCNPAIAYWQWELIGSVIQNS
jgi:hypothetical protein